MVSIECLQRAWATPTKTPYEKLVLARLADRANSNNACWPGVASLVKECCLSDRTVRRALKGLIDAGLIAVESVGGGSQSNTYVLKLPEASIPTPEPHPPMSNRPRGPIDPTVQQTPERGLIDRGVGSIGQGGGVYWTPESKVTQIEPKVNPQLLVVDSKGKKLPGRGYHKDCRAALHFLNEAAGVHYREVDSNLSVISARLNEPDVTLEGVKKMIQRQCQRWKGTPQGEYLRPGTLFAKSKFDAYYAVRDNPVQSESLAPTNVNGNGHHEDAFFRDIGPEQVKIFQQLSPKEQNSWRTDWEQHHG